MKTDEETLRASQILHFRVENFLRGHIACKPRC